MDIGKLPFMLLAGLLLGMTAAPCRSQSRPSKQLPAAIVANLDRRFPGWQLALPNDQLYNLANRDKPVSREELCVVRGDFDGNGRRDYAVLVITNPRTQSASLIVYLRRGSGYRHRTLERAGAPWTGDGQLSVAPKGMKDFDYTHEREITYRLPTLMFGGETGGYSYIYRNGRFHRIISSD